MVLAWIIILIVLVCTIYIRSVSGVVLMPDYYIISAALLVFPPVSMYALVAVLVFLRREQVAHPFLHCATLILVFLFPFIKRIINYHNIYINALFLSVANMIVYCVVEYVIRVMFVDVPFVLYEWYVYVVNIIISMVLWWILSRVFSYNENFYNAKKTSV